MSAFVLQYGSTKRLHSCMFCRFCIFRTLLFSACSDVYEACIHTNAVNAQVCLLIVFMHAQSESRIFFVVFRSAWHSFVASHGSHRHRSKRQDSKTKTTAIRQKKTSNGEAQCYSKEGISLCSVGWPSEVDVSEMDWYTRWSHGTLCVCKKGRTALRC